MIYNVKLEKVLFLDVETVAAEASYDDLDEDFQALWNIKAESIIKRGKLETKPEELYDQMAGVFAEFGKIVCISVGYFSELRDGQREFRVKSFYGDDEAILLAEFAELISNYFNNPDRHYFCGHNIKEFDIPYIGRRMLVHQIPLPNMVNIPGKKPWEVKYLLDTMQLWKFGDYKAYTSLNLLAKLFGIPTPKDDIDGSMVNGLYWQGDQLERIAEYCEKDVVATASLFLGMRALEPLKPDEVIKGE